MIVALGPFEIKVKGRVESGLSGRTFIKVYRWLLFNDIVGDDNITEFETQLG